MRDEEERPRSGNALVVSLARFAEKREREREREGARTRQINTTREIADRFDRTRRCMNGPFTNFDVSAHATFRDILRGRGPRRGRVARGVYPD